MKNALLSFLLVVVLPFSTFADMVYPVDPSKQYQLINTDDCTTWGAKRGWFNVDGTEQPLPANLKPLLVVDQPSLPEIDANLRRIESPYIICGPNTSTCFDTTTVHEDGVGCAATDTLQQIHRVVDLSTQQRLMNLRNIATSAMSSNFDTDELARDTLLYMSLISRLLNSETLPTDVQGVNLQEVYEQVAARIRAATDPNAIRYFNLVEKVEAGTINDSEMETGWSVP